jgi:hypothetical protein
MPASALQQIEGGTEVLVAQLLELSSKVVPLSAELHMHLQDPVIPCTALPAAGVEELLDVLLQLADRLLYQQPPSQTAATSSSSTSSSSSSSTCSSLPVVRSLCAGQLLPLLLDTACDSHDNYSGRNQCGTFHSPAAGNCSNIDVGVPLLATKFVGFVTAIDATVRAVSAALQSGAISATKDPQLATFVGSLSRSMLLPDTKQPYLLQHMGLCGPAALAQEQQQLYSLLSTLQKLRWCVWAEDPLCSQTLTASCCLAAGHAAVELLKMTLSAGAGGSAAPSQQPQPSTAAAAAAQQPAVSYLPSLVIFGRCLLQWAEQLQQQEPDLLLEAGDLQQTTQGLLYDHSAARVCIPGLRQGSAIKPGERLESLAATVSEWVSGLDCESTQAQLRAAGCSPEQLQQQLGVLLSAQQGTQQGLTDASLAALVQQLQATGAMLGSIAVPHFCNNPACANLSGPTDVRLVSGRSCICAGCRIARYCGRTCQRAAWKQHKPVCKELAAAAATAATAEGS